MSKINVNTIEPSTGTTLSLGGSGDSVGIGKTSTTSTLDVNGEVTGIVKRIYLKTTNNQSIANGATVYKTWETQTHIDTDTFTHSASSDNITIDRAGLYHIIVNLSFENTVDSARNTVRTSIRINGTELVSARSYDYDRGALYGRHSNNKINTIQNLSASDVIDVIMFGENIDGTLTVEAPECELHIYRMGISS